MNIVKYILDKINKYRNTFYKIEWNRNHDFLMEVPMCPLSCPIKINIEDIRNIWLNKQECSLVLYIGKDIFQIGNEKLKNVLGVGSIEYLGNSDGFDNLLIDLYQDYYDEKMTSLVVSEKKIGIFLLDHYEMVLQLDQKKLIVASKNGADADRISQIVLSENNIRTSILRKSNISSDFYEMIYELKEYCNANQIDLKDICIIGSASLELFGIKKANDIDIIMLSEIRIKYGENRVKLTDTIDLVKKGYLRDRYKVIIPDDELILNDKYHFVYMSCKFINLEYLYLKKIISGRKKDFNDRRKIEIFFDYILNMSDFGGALRTDIIEEIQRNYKTTIYNVQ